MEGVLGIRILGPASAPIAKLRGRFRSHILLQSKELEPLQNARASRTARTDGTGRCAMGGGISIPSKCSSRTIVKRSQFRVTLRGCKSAPLEGRRLQRTALDACFSFGSPARSHCDEPVSANTIVNAGFLQIYRLQRTGANIDHPTFSYRSKAGESQHQVQNDNRKRAGKPSARSSKRHSSPRPPCGAENPELRRDLPRHFGAAPSAFTRT